MDAISLLARGTLVVVFGVAAIAKARDQRRTRRSAVALGVPRWAASAVAVLLPFVEAALAVGLFTGRFAVAAAWATVAVLAAFSAIVGRTLSTGERPDCGCFGAADARPISWRSLGRNAVLAALAFSVIATADNRAIAAVGDLRGVEAVAVAVGGAVLLLWAFVDLRRVVDPSPVRPLTAGDRAPELELPCVDGSRISLNGLLALGRPVLIVFASTSCGSCRTLLPQLAAWQRFGSDRISMPVVVQGSPDAVRAEAERCGVATALIDGDGSAAARWGVERYPSAALLSGEGELAAPIGSGSYGVYKLLLDGLGLGEFVQYLIDADADAHASVTAIDRDPLESEHIDLDHVAVALPSTKLLTHKDEPVLVDPATGTVVLLNPSAAAVWQCLDGTGTLGEVAADISDIFQIDLDRARADVIAAARQFGAFGLLSAGGAAMSDPGAD